MRVKMNEAVDQVAFKITRKVAAERRARVIIIVEGFPEADTVATGNHLSLEVRQKRFGWYLDNHHGDGRLAINCKAPRGVAQQLAEHAPDRFHIPKYVSHLGWVGLWLNRTRQHWYSTGSGSDRAPHRNAYSARRPVATAPGTVPTACTNVAWFDLDTPQIDWTEVEAILVGAYRLTAPKKLIAELDSEKRLQVHRKP